MSEDFEMPEYGLRDEFAITALTGFIAMGPVDLVDIRVPGKKAVRTPTYKDYAEHSYMMADAMLEARKKPTIDKKDKI